MRNVLKVVTVFALFAIAGCVYPGYTYVRDGYGGGYYTGDRYGYYTGDGYYDGGYAPAYLGYYDCCYYGPSVDIGIGYYDYHHGGRYGGYRGSDRHSWHGHDSHRSRHRDSSHHDGSSHHH